MLNFNIESRCQLLENVQNTSIIHLTNGVCGNVLYGSVFSRVTATPYLLLAEDNLKYTSVTS